MKTQNRKILTNTLICALILLTVSHCRKIRETCVTPNTDGALFEIIELNEGPGNGALSRKDFLSKVREILEKQTGQKPGRLLSVGHQLGNFKVYPVFADKVGHKDFDSTREMLYSYTRLRLDGIELDVQLGPELKTPYIIHERIIDFYSKINSKWEKARSFFEKNSLERLLESYLQKKLHQKGKYIFIELKAKHSYKLDEIEEQTIEKTMKTLERVISKRPDGAAIRKKIAFISFNHMALLNAMNSTACGEEQNIACGESGYGYHYIAGSNLPQSYLYSTLLCPEFNSADHLFVKRKKDAAHKELWEMLNADARLTGVWLLPNAVINAPKEFSRINANREKSLGPESLLKFYLSTYQVSHKKFLDHLDNSKHRGKYGNYYGQIEGLIFDVKR